MRGTILGARRIVGLIPTIPTPEPEPSDVPISTILDGNSLPILDGNGLYILDET